MKTHSYTATLLNKGQLFKAPTQKVTVKPGQDAEQVCREHLTQLCGTKYTIHTIKVSSLANQKPIKKSVRLNEQHDYITLTATFPDGVARLTASRSGCKASGDLAVNRPTIQAFSRLLRHHTPVAVMKALKELAERSPTGESFIASLLTLEIV